MSLSTRPPATPTDLDPYPTRVSDTPQVIGRREPVVYGTPDDGPIDAETLTGFERDGYLTVDELISEDEVAELRAEIARLSADESIRGDGRVILEPSANEVRSIFEVHKLSPLFADLAADPRVAGRARQILGSGVYVHQSRVNYKPGFIGKDFYWHSDFETWHAEDGIPRMRTVSVSVSLTDNSVHNGALMIMPGSHKTFISCVGETPADHYQQSLKVQEIGTPDEQSLQELAAERGIEVFTGKAGSATMFDCNCMHASAGNITPYPRSNIFLVYNSVENLVVEPFAAPAPRPSFIGARDFTPVA